MATKKRTAKAVRKAGTGQFVPIAARGAKATGVKIPHHSIRAARDNISQLIAEVRDSASAAFSLGRRESRSAVLLSFERVEPLFREDYASRLAFVVVENLLGDAPLHIRNPQIDELLGLSKEDLLLIASVEKLPLKPRLQKDLEARLDNPEALHRLIKRFELTEAISRAREQGLYEVAEHRMSQIDLDEDD